MLSAGLGGQHPAARVEIGRNPCRDRSGSGSRSVVLPVRGCGVSLHLRQGECFGCGGSRWGDSREWRSYGSGFTVAGRLCWCSRVPPGVVGVAHSRAPRVGENRGIMRNSTISSDHGPAPMCADPLTAHGNPTTTQHTHRKIPSFQQKPAPHPAEAPPSHVQHQRQPHPKHAPTTPHTEIGPVPARDRSNSARPTRRRSTHDKLRGQNHMPHLGNHRRTADPRKHDRSRRETQPISARVTTDLDASFDRSRGGTGPISARGW